MRWPFPIATMLHSSCATVLGYEVYGGNCHRIIDWLHTGLRKLSDAKYWVLYRVHPDYRYHIIRTGLPPAYHCEGTLILHGCMAMLCRYIDNFGLRDEQGRSGEAVVEEFNKELRQPDKNAPEGMNERQADRQADALAIYRWWKYEKPADEQRRDEMMTNLYRDKDRVSFAPCADNPHLSEMVFKEFEGDDITLEKQMRALDEKIDDDEQKMMHRLIDIRRSLWT